MFDTTPEYIRIHVDGVPYFTTRFTYSASSSIDQIYGAGVQTQHIVNNDTYEGTIVFKDRNIREELTQLTQRGGRPFPVRVTVFSEGMRCTLDNTMLSIPPLSPGDEEEVAVDYISTELTVSKV